MTGEVLFLAHRVPFPPDRGDRIRSWNVLKAIAALAPTHVCALLDPADDPDTGHDDIRNIAASFHTEPQAYSRGGAMMRALFNGQPASVCAFASPALQARVDALLAARPIRTIYAFSGQMAQFVPELRGDRRFVMDFVDMDSAKFASFGAEREGFSGFANRIEGRRLLAFETRTAERADLSLFVSAAEAILFRSITGLGRDKVGFLENGIDLDRYDPSRAFPSVAAKGTPLIVFTGQMDYRPNVEAVALFARETLPLVRENHPEAWFAIVGRAPTPEVRALASLPGVMVTGEVPDTRDWLAAADIVVAPLRLARGIQNKVLEAMAMARPVVASPAAAEGIDAVRGEQLIVAEGTDAEARAIGDLIADPARAKAIGNAARAQMVARYSWPSRLAGLPGILGLE